MDHFQFLIQQGNCRQDAIAVQTIRVQIIGFEIGSGDESHAVGEHGIQKPVQNHGIRDIGHVEFIKTNQLETLGHSFSQFVQWVDRALQFMQFTVHFTHEFMKMQSRFSLNRHRIEKTIHEKAFPTSDTTVHVNPFGNFRPADQFFESIGSFVFVHSPIVGATIQSCHRSQLCGVTHMTAFGQFLKVNLVNRHDGCRLCPELHCFQTLTDTDQARPGP